MIFEVWNYLGLCASAWPLNPFWVTSQANALGCLDRAPEALTSGGSLCFWLFASLGNEEEWWSLWTVGSSSWFTWGPAETTPALCICWLSLWGSPGNICAHVCKYRLHNLLWTSLLSSGFSITSMLSASNLPQFPRKFQSADAIFSGFPTLLSMSSFHI